MNSSSINKLNAFEIYCLVDMFKSISNEKCNMLLDILMGRDKLNDYKDGNNEFNNVFDKVLNAKATEGKLKMAANKPIEKDLSRNSSCCSVDEDDDDK